MIRSLLLIVYWKSHQSHGFIFGEKVKGVREALDIVIDVSLPASRVVRTLEQLKSQRGLHKMIRVDNGLKITSQVFVDWCEANDVEIAYIEPGKFVS